MIVVGSSVCFAANAEKIDFGDFSLEIDGVLLSNETNNDITAYKYQLNDASGKNDSNEFKVITVSATNSLDEAVNELLGKGYEKLGEVNGFVLLSSGTSGDEYKYTALYISSGGTGIMIYFDDLDAGKKIINTYKDA